VRLVVLGPGRGGARTARSTRSRAHPSGGGSRGRARGASGRRACAGPRGRRPARRRAFAGRGTPRADCAAPAVIGIGLRRRVHPVRRHEPAPAVAQVAADARRPATGCSIPAGFAPAQENCSAWKRSRSTPTTAPCSRAHTNSRGCSPTPPPHVRELGRSRRRSSAASAQPAHRGEESRKYGRPREQVRGSSGCSGGLLGRGPVIADRRLPGDLGSWHASRMPPRASQGARG
jgi:hypothetical protein